MLIPGLLIVVAFALVVGGVALWSVPAAMVVAGTLLGSAGLLVNFDALLGREVKRDA